jgi:hypothetical protein
MRTKFKCKVFKESEFALLTPEFGPPKWVVQTPCADERVFDTGEEAIGFVREFLNRVTV